MTETKEAYSILSHESYKTYLRETIPQLPRKGRGFRSTLARAIRCQTAYVSQILNGNAHLSLEQGLVVNRLLGHSEEESHFFLLLIQQERSGTRELREFFERQIELARSKRNLLRERFKTKKQLSLEQSTIYYSEWYYSAIHLLTSIPSLQSRAAIGTALNLGTETLLRAIQFLLEAGLIVESRGRLGIGEVRLHLGGDSPLISKHHINWRLQAMRSFEQPSERDLHYTSVVTISTKDAQTLRSLFVDAMERYNRTVAQSAEEECHCLNMDFFRVEETET